MAFPRNRITLEDPIGFGAHRNLTGAQVIEQKPDYLLWLRDQRWKTELQVDGKQGDAQMDTDIHLLLDTYLGGNKKLQAKYTFSSLQTMCDTDDYHDNTEQAKEPAVLTEGWGDW